ncbi:carboxymuconolactone decarboxylase family protein [Methylobacterium oxalidis]|uniref:Carboxymuconolactone decarboxylase-like domain-containing protein n=1 Tax=Methylobacterium oxalidis TaxID=944322 RepID=A0A512IZB9_9HYPH|nr:carboxymuconolactone decarboxylase family protein [Methylobacterium oxalidis]GEP03052.1 hypothetical protein MOX02_10900 [Methylobacterium oxalidis]GJE31670.1 hypothetical protein LDDCCGHA_1850 [Methylobacterium oxalidis]GLS65985.1 hypothetical protein GCM10007888_43670 [Methylobacterium oxalidis]
MQIQSAFGVVPNMFKAVTNSPAALASLWGSFDVLGRGRIGAKLGEQIAVAVADRNHCAYCLAAHTVLGQKAGATSAEMAEAQRGRSTDPKTAAALAFAVKVVECRAAIETADAADIERWLIGHASEIAAAGLDPRKLRADSEQHGLRLREAGARLFADWLASLDRPSSGGCP